MRANQQAAKSDIPRVAPELKFVAAVALRFDNPESLGETPEGVRFHFRVHGTVQWPELQGKFPPCMAYLSIDPDGVGTINVRAPLHFDDGATAELLAGMAAQKKGRAAIVAQRPAYVAGGAQSALLWFSAEPGASGSRASK